MKHLYRKQEENSTVTTPSPISTTQIYRHPYHQYDSFQTLLPTLFYMSVTTSLRC